MHAHNGGKWFIYFEVLWKWKEGTQPTKVKEEEKITLLSNGSALLFTLQHENKDLVHCMNLVTTHQDNF